MLIDYVASYIAIAAVMLSVSVAIFFTNRKKRLNQVFSAYSLCIGSWALFTIPAIVTQDAQVAVFWLKAMLAAVYFIPTLFLHFSTEFLQLGPERKSHVMLSYATSCMFLISNITSWTIAGAAPSGPLRFYTVPGPLFHLQIVHFLVVSLYGILLLYKPMKDVHQSSKMRTHAQFLFWTTLIGYLGGAPQYACAYRIHLPVLVPYGNYCVVLYGLTIAYLILQHQFLGIRLVVRRSLVYSALVACITVLHLSVVYLLERLLREFVGYATLSPAILSAAALALCFQPLKNRIQALVDRLFFRKSHLALAEENAQLWQAVTRAEQLKAAGTLASGVAHELRNPLTSVQTFCEVLPERSGDPAFVAKFQAVVPQELRRIRGILDDLLTFARPRELQLEAVGLVAVVTETLELLSYDLLRRRIQCTTQLDGAPVIQADPTRVKQVVLNLVLNALQAMGTDGQLTVTVQPEGTGCRLTVQDTGPGLPPEVLERLGEPFLTTRPGGTGLGLPVVQTLVEQHGGTVEFQSEAGVGTTVVVWWPGSKDEH